MSFVNRQRQFGVSLPFAWHTVAVFLCQDYHQRETAFHQLFAEKRQNGEWFSLGIGEILVIWMAGGYKDKYFGEFYTRDQARRYRPHLLEKEDDAIVISA